MTAEVELSSATELVTRRDQSMRLAESSGFM